MRNNHILVSIWLLLTAVSTSVQAAVVESTDVMIGGSSFETFIDDTTGLTWLDLDNFWDGTSSYASITSLLAGSGFHIANPRELSVLQSSISASAFTFTEAIIIGANYLGNLHPGDDRELMWGIYDDGNSSDAIAYSWRSANILWESGGYISASSALSSLNPAYQDLGAWVVEDSTIPQVPVPAAFWLFVSGLLGLIGVARRKYN